MTFLSNEHNGGYAHWPLLRGGDDLPIFQGARDVLDDPQETQGDHQGDHPQDPCPRDEVNMPSDADEHGRHSALAKAPSSRADSFQASGGKVNHVSQPSDDSLTSKEGGQWRHSDMNRQRAGETQAAARRLVNPTMMTMNTQGCMCIGDAICSVLEDEGVNLYMTSSFSPCPLTRMHP